VEIKLIFYSATKKVESRPLRDDSPWPIGAVERPGRGEAVRLPLGRMCWQQEMSGKGRPPWTVQEPSDVGAYIEFRNPG
jgi:hypothetical protein